MVTLFVVIIAIYFTVTIVGTLLMMGIVTEYEMLVLMTGIFIGIGIMVFL